MGQFKNELPICNEWQKENAVSLVHGTAQADLVNEKLRDMFSDH